MDVLDVLVEQAGSRGGGNGAIPGRIMDQTSREGRSSSEEEKGGGGGTELVRSEKLVSKTVLVYGADGGKEAVIQCACHAQRWGEWVSFGRGSMKWIKA